MMTTIINEDCTYSAVIFGRVTYESSLGSSKWNPVSTRWPPTNRPSCKLHLFVCQ